MRGFTRAPKSRRRRKMQVELLEDRQLLATITVNTTADGTAANATLSLRQAIEVSDGTLAVSSLSSQEQAEVSGSVGSSNTIDFNIPTTDPGYNATTGAWTIAVNSALPAISTNAAIIDGYSQPGATENTLAQGDNAKLEIAIDSPSHAAATGLAVGQPGSQVRGLDFENFGVAGIVITAAGNAQVAGCFIGTDPSGETAAPNAYGVEIENSSNLIGGSSVGDRNVISGNNSLGIYVPATQNSPPVPEPTGNLIENNFIGIDAAGTKALANGLDSDGPGVLDSGSGDIYGGTTAGLGNVISGNSGGGIQSYGSITIEGNYIGTDATGDVALGNGGSSYGGITAKQGSGGAPVTSTTITGNVVSGNTDGGIAVYASSQPSQATFLIANNLIGTNAAGTAALGNSFVGLRLDGTVENAKVLDNVISATTTDPSDTAPVGLSVNESGATDVENNVIQGNLIGTDKTGTVALGNAGVGMDIEANGNTIGGTGPGQGNVIAFSGHGGISVIGSQDPLIQNSIFGNSGAGISYQAIGSNQLAAPPLMTFTPGGVGGGTLSGTLTESPNLTYVVEIFSNPSVPTPGQEQGKTFIQDVTVNTDSSGHGTFSVSEPIAIYTATATNPDGNTSAFSNAVGSQTPVTSVASVTTVSSSVNPSVVGQEVVITAVVTAPGYSGTPTGTITFTIDGQDQAPESLSVVGGVDEAQLFTSALTVGEHTVSAEYSGDANVNPSNGALPAQVVNDSSLLPTTTALASSSNPTTTGQQVTFTAVVSAEGASGTPTGAITFTIDGNPEPPVSLEVVDGNDQAAFSISTLTAGAHTVTATYSGDSTFDGSSVAGPLTQTVDAPNQPNQPIVTSTTLVSSMNPSDVGQTVTFTATVTPTAAAGTPTGTVTFTVDGVAASPVPLRVVDGKDQAAFTTATLTAGTHTIGATYDGDAGFAGSTVSHSLTETVIAPTHPATVATTDPPAVISVKRYGVHMEPTVLVITFSAALDPSRAEDVHNYRIVGPSGRVIGIESAVYDPVAHTVTLRPRSRISIHHTSRITVIGTGTRGVAGVADTLLDGSGDGKSGSSYVAPLTWRNLVLTPAQARRLQLEEHAARSRS
jgi:parallel beta-helix repeat protein